MGTDNGGNITARDGRDHWAGCFFALFAGGGVRGGQVIGKSDKHGAYPAINPYKPSDLGATVYTALGVDPDQRSDRPERPADDAQPRHADRRHCSRDPVRATETICSTQRGPTMRQWTTQLLVSPLLRLRVFVVSVLAASPSLGSVQPRGAQRGTDVTFVLGGGNLADAQEVLFYSPGLTVTKLEVVNDAQVKATVKIAADCRLGEHAFRVRTATGVTRAADVLGRGAAGRRREGAEQRVRRAAEDRAQRHRPRRRRQRGRRLLRRRGQEGPAASASRSRGCGSATTFFDPYVAILDAKRFELATSRRHRRCSGRTAAARSSPRRTARTSSRSARASTRATAAASIGCTSAPSRGRLAVVPAGGKPGEEVEVRFLGDPAGEIKQKVKLPAAMPTDGKFGVFCQDAGGISPSGLPFRVDRPSANVVEAEPNDAAAQATAGDAARARSTASSTSRATSTTSSSRPRRGRCSTSTATPAGSARRSTR